MRAFHPKNQASKHVTQSGYWHKRFFCFGMRAIYSVTEGTFNQTVCTFPLTVIFHLVIVTVRTNWSYSTRLGWDEVKGKVWHYLVSWWPSGQTACWAKVLGVKRGGEVKFLKLYILEMKCFSVYGKYSGVKWEWKCPPLVRQVLQKGISLWTGSGWNHFQLVAVITELHVRNYRANTCTRRIFQKVKYSLKFLENTKPQGCSFCFTFFSFLYLQKLHTVEETRQFKVKVTESKTAAATKAQRCIPTLRTLLHWNIAVDNQSSILCIWKKKNQRMGSTDFEDKRQRNASGESSTSSGQFSSFACNCGILCSVWCNFCVSTTIPLHPCCPHPSRMQNSQPKQLHSAFGSNPTSSFFVSVFCKHLCWLPLCFCFFLFLTLCFTCCFAVSSVEHSESDSILTESDQNSSI